MKNVYLVDTRDLKRIRHMARLLKRAVVEIIELKKLIPPSTEPHTAPTTARLNLLEITAGKGVRMFM